MSAMIVEAMDHAGPTGPVGTTSSTSLVRRSDIADSMDQIFEPIRAETLGTVFAEHRRLRGEIERVAALIGGPAQDVVPYFLRGNGYDGPFPERIFGRDGAITALDAEFWQRALALTDIYQAMPQKRRDEWNKLISERRTPTFDESTVLSTLQTLMAERHKFFSERVDGIFSSLSREHVTNVPQGFRKRMIIAHVVGGWHIVDVSRAGTINDLRCVVAKFMGRDEPQPWITMRSLEYAQRERRGQWVDLDGGAVRVRVYGNGNAHLEVHPEIAWRLNQVLAHLHPTAIPAEHRRRPARRYKAWRLFSRPLPFAVLGILADGRCPSAQRFELRYRGDAGVEYDEACAVLEALGGVGHGGNFAFDYPAADVIREVVASGMLPDQRSHQYYPTPAALGARVVAAAQIGPRHTVLEPSAGQGALAALLPAARTTCVEVAPLFCGVLRARGLEVIEHDFLTWSPRRRFDRVVMNPPFAGGRWRAHLEHAAERVAGSGRLVAVLPAAARDKRDLLPGWSCSWSEPIPFPGTSIEVSILTAVPSEER